MTYAFAALRDEYTRLWLSMKPLDGDRAELNAIATKLYKNIGRYQKVESATKVPASVIAVIHNRESDADFATHLHNGDSLKRRTFHVPAGRPVIGDPPFTWEESAVDALRLDGLSLAGKWTVEQALFMLEGYNGWGYRQYHPETDSPYLWAGTNIQDPGKYVADGKFNRSAFDTQLGCAPLLGALWTLDPSLSLPMEGARPAPRPEAPEISLEPPVLPEPAIPWPDIPDDPPKPTIYESIAARLRRLFS